MPRAKLTIKIVLLLLTILFLCPLLCFGTKDFGKTGVTYKIAEPDALKEIKKKAAAIDWSKVFDKDKAARNIKAYRPKNLAFLPNVTQNNIFKVDMTYTLDMDIPDGNGGILYKKGYSFNPLDYIKLHQILVFINGKDKTQVQWFKDSQYYENIKTRLIITDGSWHDLTKLLKRPVFYLTQNIAQRLQLKAVPSVAKQKGKMMQVNEVYIED